VLSGDRGRFTMPRGAGNRRTVGCVQVVVPHERGRAMTRSRSNDMTCRVGLITVLVLLVLGLSACRTSTPTGTAGSVAASVATTRAAMTTGTPAVTDAPVATSAAATTNGEEPTVILGPAGPSFARAPQHVAWLSVRDDRDPRRVVITFMTGDCDGSADATAADDGTTVTVSLVVDQEVSGGCDAVGWLRFADVALPRALAGRSVVDATSHQEHRVFDGAALLSPAALPQGLALAREVAADSLRPAAAAVVPAPGYWERVWAPPSAPGSHLSGCEPTRDTARSIALTQGPGRLPQWEPAGLRHAGTVRLDGQDVDINRVIASDDLVLDWHDPATHLNHQLSSDEECPGVPPYTVAAFSRIAQSLH
jgi:hypothetical protein